MVVVSRHLIKRDGGDTVELFQAKGGNTPHGGAMLFVHGNQGGRLIGAKEAVDSGILARVSARLNITAAAVSQPGFGASDGPPDFCGPETQQAIMAALSFLMEQPSVDPERVVLYGNSRGAVASAMVASRFPELRAVVLSSGVYDLKEVIAHCSEGLRRAIRTEAGLSNEAFRLRSALYHAHKIRSDVLLLHGRYDDRAPVTQAEAFSDALADAGVAAVLNVFDCGHRIPRELTQSVLGPFLKRMFGGNETYH
ncbi:alpha/beta hydrolase family protein [Roseibium aggregatum]|uniref:alpha/beta hydrolase family protein n=1 Tax=Roseibium aggregatum TaxID=187304 RepID=UPI001AD8D541|nr:prolyl oligopeptidase family serine peptidase [Roseibium aggregatum]